MIQPFSLDEDAGLSLSQCNNNKDDELKILLNERNEQ